MNSMTTPIYQRSYSEEEYDEYIENTPLEARFDISTLQLLVTEAFPKHQAYGMLFEEYARKRGMFMNMDESEKKRLSFYIPKFIARVSSDLAVINNVSHYRFMMLMIELGMITFQVDYHEEYSHAKHSRDNIFRSVQSEEQRRIYYHMEKINITLDSASGSRTGAVKHLTPTVPEWLYNAVSDTANYLNMTNSDFTFLCWCIAVQNCLPEGMVPRVINEPIQSIVTQFNFELKEFDDTVTRTMKKLSII